MEESGRKWLERGLRDAILAGDESAWQALYESCFNRLYAHVFYRAGRDRQRAEEVVQDCWLVAVKRIGHFDPDRGTFEQWMQGIAENVLRNRRRSWWRRDRTEIQMEADAVVPAAAGGLAVAEQVALTLAGLPAQYQAVLRAKYQHQLPVADIAARWNATPKAVESLLSRARTAFRQAYTRLDASDNKE